jgi:RNA polymerase primary sigma factor
MLAKHKNQQHKTALSSLETYLRDINETPLLNAEEERALAHRIRGGDTTARDQMVRANLRLVVNIARGYTGKGLDLSDLIEEGNLGLLHAAECFDPDMNTRFSTYAGFWIKQSMRRAVINSGKTIRLPAYMVILLADWRRANAELREKLGRPPTPDEMAQRLNLPKKKMQLIKKALRVYNANPQTVQADDTWLWEEDVIDRRTPTPERQMVDGDDLHQVLNLLETMDPREATVIRLRFGLTGEEPLTLQQIGEHLNLTRERVRQIESEALTHLQECMQAD